MMGLENGEPECWDWPVTETDLQRAGDGSLVSDTLALGAAFLARWQDGRCAFCGWRGQLFLDHDHLTALIRGWLCRGCNAAEGHGHLPGTAMARYRERNPASMVGVVEVYWSPFTGRAVPRRCVDPMVTAAAAAAAVEAISRPLLRPTREKDTA